MRIRETIEFAEQVLLELANLGEDLDSRDVQ